jgi:hypothetical protein
LFYDRNKYTVTWKNDDESVLEVDEWVFYWTMPSYDWTTPVKTWSVWIKYTFDWWIPNVVVVTGNVVYKAKYKIKDDSHPSWWGWWGWWGGSWGWGSSSKSMTWSDETIWTWDSLNGSWFDDIWHGSWPEEPTTWNVKDSQILHENNEIMEAYLWAYANKITTISSFKKAKPDWVLIRWHLAKMVVNYVVNVLWRKMPTQIPTHCKRDDDGKQRESKEIKDYAEKACALWLMWIRVKDNKFRPKDSVTRAEFGTVLSRILWWDKYDVKNATKSNPYYVKHLNALKENGIMLQIQHPTEVKELRKWVWVMLRRTRGIF